MSPINRHDPPVIGWEPMDDTVFVELLIRLLRKQMIEEATFTGLTNGLERPDLDHLTAALARAVDITIPLALGTERLPKRGARGEQSPESWLWLTLATKLGAEEAIAVKLEYNARRRARASRKPQERVTRKTVKEHGRQRRPAVGPEEKDEWDADGNMR